MAQQVRNIAPFINDVFYVTSPWWNERINPITGQVEIHRGLDIATVGSKPVYSLLTGIVHSKGYDANGRGNWIIIKDNNTSSPFYGYATLYMHLAELPLLNVGDVIQANQYVAMEGTTGQSTGIHLHVEMQNINLYNNQWHISNTKTDYIDPTIFMGIDNIEDSSWIYDGTPYIPPTKKQNNKFPWVLYARKLRKKHNI